MENDTPILPPNEPELSAEAVDPPRVDEDLACFACGYNLRTILIEGRCPECDMSVDESIEAKRRGLEDGGGFAVMTRIIMAIIGIALPVASFGLAEAMHELFVDWQSDEWRDMVAMFLGGSPARPFYPLLIFCAVSLGAVLFQPRGLGRKPWVLVGLVAGVVIGIQYTLIMGIIAGGLIGAGLAVAVIGSVLIGIAVWRENMKNFDKPSGSRLAKKKKVENWVWIVLISLVILIGLIWFRIMFAFIFVFGLLGSPLLYFLVFQHAMWKAIDLRKAQGKQVAQGAALLAWRWWFGVGSAYVLMWGGSVALALMAYAKLPMQSPGCYVATAAAKGHRRFVGSQAVALPDGQTLWVNRQLRILKASEIAMRQVSPRLHRMVRRIYDTVGPRAAAGMRWRWVADAGFVLLCPAAWVSDAVLRRVVPGYERLLNDLYREPREGGLGYDDERHE